MKTTVGELPDDVLFAVCERFVQRQRAQAIADWVTRQGYECTREQVYALVNRGLRQDFLRFNPPEELVCAREIRRKYPQAADVRVINTRGDTAVQHLGVAGADLILSLIRDLHKTKDTVHVGFGAGSTTQQVAKSLGRLLESQHGLPHLVIHALSSGFAIRDPLTAPVAFFAYFSGIHPPVDFVGLFAPAVVKFTKYEEEKHLPGVIESFKEAEHLDIVVTSLASAKDEHGLLNRFFHWGKNTKGLQNLKKAGWLGDVQWRPYSAEGPILVNTGIRAVTLFELDELKDFVAGGKHVVLLAGPCNECGESKAAALSPLLEKESLRVFNHLVMDISTAKDVLS